MAMKRAYAEQTEMVARYEAKLRRFAERLGESFEAEGVEGVTSDE
jgi:hypothetical protein